MPIPSGMPTPGDPMGKPIPADIAIKNRQPNDTANILFKNVRILDSTGREPYSGDVYISGNTIKEVGKVSSDIDTSTTTIIDGKGTKTLMSGLCDSQTHHSWNNSPTLDVPKGESVIPVRAKVKKAANGHGANGNVNEHANGNPDDEGAESNGVSGVSKKGKKQAGFFEYGVAEDDLPMSGEGNNGGKTGVSVEMVKSL